MEEFHGLVAQGYDNVATIAANAEWRYDNWYGWEMTQKLFSMGETLAHLFHLASSGRIEVSREGRYAYRFTAR